MGAVAGAEKLAVDERFDVEGLLQFLDSQGGHGQSAATNAELLEHLKQNTLGASKRPQLVVFFTNGSFDGIIGRYVSAVRAAGS